LSPQTKVDVEIFGEHYKLKGEASPEYMMRLARYVDQTMREVVRRNPRLTVHKAAILSAINIADELLRLLDGQETQSDDEPGDDDDAPEEKNESKKPEGKSGKKKKKKKG